MSGVKKAAARIALTLVSLLLALGLAEGAFRWREAATDDPGSGDDGWYERYRNMNRTIYRRSENDDLIYEPTPGASVEMEYGPAGFNAAGMRDEREHAREPDPERTRVAILGDSLVWSEFLPLYDSIPRRAEGSLGRDFEVLAFGVTGYDTAQEAAWYEAAVRPFAPDVVVVVFCMNDMMIMSGPFERYATDEERAQKDAQEALMAREAPVRRETIDAVLEERERNASLRIVARALGIWERWRFDRSYTDEYLVAFRDPPRRARTRAALQRLGAALRADHARGVLVISPVLEAWDDYHWHAIHDFVRQEAEAAGFIVVDPLESWRGAHTPDEMRVGGDNLHYDESGARVMGSVIADAVREVSR